MKNLGIQNVVINKRISFEYVLFKKYESGIVLTGKEVKSIRVLNGVQIKNSYVKLINKEAWVFNLSINLGIFTHTSNVNIRCCKKKLLLQRKELLDIVCFFQRYKNCCIVVTKVYWKKAFIKIEIALAKRKKIYE